MAVLSWPHWPHAGRERRENGSALLAVMIFFGISPGRVEKTIEAVRRRIERGER
jgi:hypothetical protein